jgi:Uma2 family endonuclease
MSVGERKMTLLQFLKLPETSPAREYVDGRIVQRMSPKFKHSRTQGGLTEAVNRWARPEKPGEAVPELRCTFGGRSLVFDVAYFRSDRIAYGPDGEVLNDVFLAPDLAVEIVSPEQSVRSGESRLQWCVRHGVQLAWLIDPERRRAKVFRPGARPLSLSGSDHLDGADVLPGFRLALATVFGWLKRPR